MTDTTATGLKTSAAIGGVLGLILVALTDPNTRGVMLPILATLASTAGAGAAAADLFNLLRSLRPSKAGQPYTRVDGWIEKALYSRAGARLSVMALAVIISVLASAVLAYVQGQPIEPSISQALAAIVASQVVHLRDLFGQQSAEAAAAELRARGVLPVTLELEDHE